MGNTGELYIVGKRKGEKSALRSNRIVKQGKIGDEKTDKYIVKALSGETGVGTKTGSTGAIEQLSYAPLDFDGLTVAERILEMLGKIGEKIELVDFKSINAPRTFAYIHTGNRLATIMGLNMSDVADIDTIGKEVTMQIAAMAPIAIDKDGVDKTTIEKEIEIGKEQARQEGKKEELLERIAQGRLAKFFKENTLLNQAFVRDNKQSVGQYLKNANKDLTVTEFYRFAL